MGAVKQFDSLSTSYVNLAALLRHLRKENFTGSIHVVMDQYEAEVQLHGADAPSVSEIDTNTRESSQTAGAMERLLVHAREPGGTIKVYDSEYASAKAPQEQSTGAVEAEAPVSFPSAPSSGSEAEVDWTELQDAAGKLIGAVERAVETVGADFDSSFRAARIQLGDDYPFLDPTGNGLVYANKRIVLSEQPGSQAFVSALTECMRRVVNKMAIGKDSKRFRETVAIELAVAVRLRPNGLSEFTTQLDRIAGTRVL